MKREENRVRFFFSLSLSLDIDTLRKENEIMKIKSAGHKTLENLTS